MAQMRAARGEFGCAVKSSVNLNAKWGGSTTKLRLPREQREYVEWTSCRASVPDAMAFHTETPDKSQAF